MSDLEKDTELSGKEKSAKEDVRDDVQTYASKETQISRSPSPASEPVEKRSTDGGHDVEAQVLNTDERPNPPPIKVPRSQRRGFLGRLTILAEVEEPKNYSRSTKWFLTFVVAQAAMAAPMGSAILFPSLNQVSEDLRSSPTVTNLSVALYMLAMSIFPLWWSSFSETLGRRTIYITSFSLFLVWNILSAVSQNITMFIIMRILSGGAAASVQAVGAGTIADIWEPKERGRAMGIFYLGPLMGPLFAPVVGGGLALEWGWRSTQWFLVIYGIVVLVFLTFALPETLKNRKPLADDMDTALVSDGRPITLSRVASKRSVQVKTKKTIRLLKRSLIDPLKIILYLRFPAVLITVYYASITFGSLYVLNISIQDTFSKPPYNFSTIEIGLCYIPNSIGYIIASLFGGKWTDSIMAREAKKAKRYDEHGKLVYRPEDRMRENAWIAAFLYPAALVWYGWTVQKGVFWVVPLASGFFFGLGSMLIFSMATTMLTEFMPRKSSSGVAANNFVRNIFSCVGGIVSQPLIVSIGNGWLFTGLGAIAAASSVVVWAMRHYGPRWRIAMDAKMN